MGDIRTDLTNEEFDDAVTVATQIARGEAEIPENSVPTSTQAAIAAAQAAANDLKIVLGMPAAPVYPEPKTYRRNPVAILFDGTDKKIAYKVGDVGVMQSFNADTVVTADETNQGGQTINRLVSSRVLGNAVVGILTPRTMSTDIDLLSITNAEFDELIGRDSTCDPTSPYRFSTTNSNTPNVTQVGFGDRVVYDMASGKAVSFWVKNRAIVTFYCDPAETQSSDIRINYNNGSIGTESIDLTGLEGRVDIEIEQSGGIDGYISIRNNNVNKCYLVGVNITTVDNLDPAEFYDSFVAWNHIDYEYWLGASNGANDFALRGESNKLFGSWHGGHSNEALTLEIGGQTIDSGSFVDQTFLTGESATFTSTSDLTDDINDATVVCKTTFSNGGHRIQTDINFDSPAILDDAYTGMTINNSRFNQVVSPIYKDLSAEAEDAEIDLGKTAVAVLADSASGHSIETRATWFSHAFTDRPGPYVKVRPNDEKFYLNSLHDANQEVSSLTAVTYHYFNS